MSNLSPVSSIAADDGPILKRDSESGVRLMQTAIFTAEPRSGQMLAEVSRARPACHSEARSADEIAVPYGSFGSPSHIGLPSSLFVPTSFSCAVFGRYFSARLM